jgi:hypothetical protein
MTTDTPTAEVVLVLPAHRRDAAGFLADHGPEETADLLDALRLVRAVVRNGAHAETRHEEELARLRASQARELERLCAEHRTERDLSEARLAATREAFQTQLAEERRAREEQWEKAAAAARPRDADVHEVSPAQRTDPREVAALADAMAEVVRTYYDARKRLPRSVADVRAEWLGKCLLLEVSSAATDADGVFAKAVASVKAENYRHGAKRRREGTAADTI